MKTVIACVGLALAASLLSHLVIAQDQGPAYINPLPGGGAIVVQPGANPYVPPTYINPLPGGGYIVTQPGTERYQPPTYITPLPGGSEMIQTPGADDSDNDGN